MRFERAIAVFLDYLKIDRGLANLTVSSYHSDLKDFCNRLELVDATVSSLNQTNLRMYLVKLNASGIKPRSRARKISCLKAFSRFLVEFWKERHIVSDGFPLSMGQILSILPILIAIAYFIYIFRKKKFLKDEKNTLQQTDKG